MDISNDLACKDFVELATEYLEATLSAEQWNRLEAHLQLCEACRRYIEQMRLTIRALRHQAGGALPPELREEMTRQLATAWAAGAR